MYRAGDMVAGFRVERHLDSGGMGDIYLVRHPRLGRLDALKVLREDASSDPHYVERFKREAVLAARLDHDNVLPVFDRGEADGRQWIHMKYVDGQNAAEALRRDGPFSARRITNLITKVASALDHAHAHGLLHRDVKPANILLGRPSVPGEPERVYLSDFGIAKGVGDAAGLTPNGRIAVTPDFAAPEQIEVRELSGRTDQYALGCVLYQLLTGTLPYPGEGEYARMNAHLTAPVPKLGLLRPGLPLAVQTVIDRALAKDPADRYESCTAMSKALETALRGVPADAAPAPDRTAPLRIPEPVTDVVPDPAPADPPTDLVPGAREDGPEPSQPHPGPLQPGPPWWTFVDRAAGLTAAAAALLFVVSLFPPTPRTSASPFPGEVATGRFAVGQLPALLLLVVAVLFQLTTSGHRRRPLLYGVAAGAGAYALIDSLRAYAFTVAHAQGTIHTDGALPRAVLGGLVVVVAGVAIRRIPPGSRMPPGHHVPLGAVLAVTGVVLAAVAVGTGPRLQGSQAGAVVYGVPFALTAGGVVLLALMVWLRRRALLAAALTLILATMVASLAAADPLHYPLAVAGNVLLLGAAAVLIVGGRRAGNRPAPPGPGPHAPASVDPWPRQPLQQPAGPFRR